MSGKFLNERCHELILNVYEYFCHEKDNFGPLRNVEAVQARTSEALKISVRTLKKIIDSKKMNLPLPKTLEKPRKKWKTDDLPASLQHTIRDIIYSKYAEKQVVTLDTMRQALEDKELLVASRPTISKILNNIGFKFKKDCNRRALCEKVHVASARVQFLRKYVDNMNSTSPLPVVFLDETWVFATGSQKRSWQDDSPKSVKNANYSSNGKRFIILHAGNQNGFIENSSLIFAANSKSDDYHDNMDAANFERWLKDQLPNLTEPSLIIMDNAAYHSRVVEKMPSSSWRKEELQKLH
ncbi:hypothetical protein PPYR_01219 [Photinus pyralis]|uniref:Tc1-like transposase DDE domain-containing protein n=1 Tax=Photinus pyralis TaxID=7054 RepID=A0A5N4B3Q7_PHOPY|nr:hypothetical protein PPYR_01219 [Photinus pyralis]